MKQRSDIAWRLIIVYALLGVFVLALIYRFIDLSILDRDYLLAQSQARILRTVEMPSYRGMITDRRGRPLAISTPMQSVWVNPKAFSATPSQVKKLAKALNVSVAYIKKRVKKHGGVEFSYLRRRRGPAVIHAVKALKLKGVHYQTEYKRFYPEGHITAHVLGFTNVDDHGQEGLELAYDQWLSGSSGKKQVLKDRLGNTIKNVRILKKPVQGKSLVLSIDQRIQFSAFQTLKKTVAKYHAKAGSIVVLNPKTGEVLAMVNEPTYNPNRRPTVHDGRFRNRAMTDIFEPGSTMKAFSVALALESGQYSPMTKIDTNPGWMQIGGYTIRDDGVNHGVITLTQLLQKSSNIGAAKVMLSLEPKSYWHLLRSFGFGQRSRSGFPGESAGTLVDRSIWRPSVVAGLAYGYGVAVTTAQLAHAYAVLADNGRKVPLTFLKRTQPVVGVQVVPEKISTEVRQMLEAVMERGGTGTRGRVHGYRVAGKTGTAYIAGPNGYYKDRYMSSFVGMAPAEDPKLVVAVVIIEPQGQHFGAIVAAPAFAKVMSAGLRLLDVAPEKEAAA